MAEEMDATGKALRKFFAGLNAEALEELRARRRQSALHPLARVLPALRDYKIETTFLDPSPEESWAALQAYTLWYEHGYRRAADEALRFWREDARRRADGTDDGDDRGQAT